MPPEKGYVPPSPTHHTAPICSTQEPHLHMPKQQHVCVKKASPIPDVWASLIWRVRKTAQSANWIFQRNKRTEEEAEGRKKGKAILSLSNSNLYWPKKSPDITFVLRKYTKDNIYPPRASPRFFLYFNWQSPRMIKSDILH